jgi:hypothetical protein
MLSNPPTGPVDIKDPRIRVTFADVAMRMANDGPMYGMIILAGLLAAKGITTGLESIVGGAFALQARSRPPENEKVGAARNFMGVGLVMLAATHFLSACR